MSLELKDYRESLESASPEVHDTLEASFAEAARVMSPAGLHNYLEGARALVNLGRGSDLVVTYLQEMPDVTKEVGEDVIKDIVAAALKLASLASGQIIALVFASLPTAARRLGDPALVLRYLQLLHNLSSKAPRGVRPMLGHLDDLFGKLTLGGLRRWALWGAEAYARDLESQAKYFGLETADSLAVLQRERRGTLFVDIHRRLNFYLRALWGRDYFMRPTSGDYETREGLKPFIEHYVIHLPDAFDEFGGLPGAELYRAAAAHAAAHLGYQQHSLSPEALTPIQMAFIGLFEDARVEQLSIRELPGLKALWLPFHEKLAQIRPPTDIVVGLMERAARAFLDETYVDEDPWVREASAAFREEFARRAEDNRLGWDLGVTFYNKLSAHTAIPSAKVLESLAIPYRDDNRYVWASEEIPWAEAEYVPAAQQQVRKTAGLMEMVNELDVEFAGDDAQEIWTLETEFFRDGDPDGVSLNDLEGKEPVSPPYHYREWDYHVQLYRPDWVAVIEKRQPKGEPETMDRVLADYRPIASRIRHIIDALQPRGIVRQRHQEDGDEIDINAAIRAMVDLRLGQTPDPRINTRYVRKVRDLAVLVLLDLSQSTNETLAGSDRPVLQLAREATGLLAWAIQGIGDPFAIHGFASNGRHDVQYFRFKNFDEAYDDDAKSGLAGMEAGLSTRMGAALRHAGHLLLQEPQQKKLLLLLSDGEPSDIDERDPQYLRFDTKKAVEELGSRGVFTYCLTLDPHADDYVSRIFGVNGYTVVDHVQRLPETLPTLFMGLTK